MPVLSTDTPQDFRRLDLQLSFRQVTDKQCTKRLIDSYCVP